MKRPTLLFLGTEDWFVRSHFLHLLKRAQQEGFDVAVAARLSGALDSIEGVRSINMPVERASRLSLWCETDAVRRLLREERPALVHAIALRPIASLLLAHPVPTVFAVTGRGYLSLQRSPLAQAMLTFVASGLNRRVCEGAGVLLVENEADLAWVNAAGARLPSERVVTMPGAGVDVSQYLPGPEQAGPIVVGVAARLVRSKGIDIAVAAISRLRAKGVEVCLHVAGSPDAGNPDCVTERELSLWKAQPGVVLKGHVEDINAFWKNVHIACLPSRGGEGLPRSLLEAAACGRPLITTNTPGCLDFMAGAEMGLLVAPGDVAKLAMAIEELAMDAVRRKQMGAAARLCVETHYTLGHAGNAAALAWRAAWAGRTR